MKELVIQYLIEASVGQATHDVQIQAKVGVAIEDFERGGVGRVEKRVPLLVAIFARDALEPGDVAARVHDQVHVSLWCTYPK